MFSIRLKPKLHEQIAGTWISSLFSIWGNRAAMEAAEENSRLELAMLRARANLQTFTTTEGE